MSAKKLKRSSKVGINKRELLLEQIIKEYIKNPEPIGSEYLKMHLNIKISSATIRNYFKKMVEDGELMQVHISSGRIPTINALKSYWRRKLLPLDPIETKDLNSVKCSAKEVGLFCAVKFYKPNRFIDLIRVGERYLILELEDGEIVISYSSAMERFLRSLLQIEIRDLENIAAQVCANELKSKISHFLKRDEINIGGSVELINMAKDIDINEQKFVNTIEGRIVENIADGIYFESIVPYGYMAIRQDIKTNDCEGKIFFLGKISKNFEVFYQMIENDRFEEGSIE